MSRIMLVRQTALIIASKAANGPPAMQLLKTNEQTNNYGMVSVEVGWGAITSPINECMGVGGIIEENVPCYTQIG